MVRLLVVSAYKGRFDQNLREQPVFMLSVRGTPSQCLAPGARSRQRPMSDGSNIPLSFPLLQDTELLASFSVEGDKLMIDAKLDK